MKRNKLAAALGIHPAQVTRLSREGMPTHDIEAARAWRNEHVAPYARAGDDAVQPSASGTVGGGSLATERAALARAQREGIEIKNAVLRGEYAPISLLGEVLATASQAVAERFEHLPGQLRRACPDMPPAAIDTAMAVIASARNEWVKQTADIVRARVMADDDDEPLTPPPTPEPSE